MTDTNAEIAEHVTRFVAALGGDDNVTGAHRVAIRRASELAVLASSLRLQALSGAGIDIAELTKIEAMADEAVGRLNIPAAPAKATEPLRVEFVEPRLSRLSDEELSIMEAIVATMNDTPIEDVPPTAEQLAFKALQEENERLRRELGPVPTQEELEARFPGLLDAVLQSVPV